MLAPPDPSNPLSDVPEPETFGQPAAESEAAPLPTRPLRGQGSSPALPTRAVPTSPRSTEALSTPELPSSSLPTRPLSSPLLPGLHTAEGSAPARPVNNSMLADQFAPTLPMSHAATPEAPARVVETPTIPQFAAFQTGPRPPTPETVTAEPAAPQPQPLALAPSIPKAVPISDAATPGYVHRPQELLGSEAELVTVAESRDESLPDPPAPLLATGWLGKFILFSGLAAVPGLFAGDFIGLGLGLASWVALVVWSAMVTANARRARPSTPQTRAPRPVSAGLSWLIAPFLAVAAFAGLVVMTGWVDEASYEEQGQRSLALAAVVFVIVVAMFAAWYRPYVLLARTARWVNTDGGKARKWFAAPFLAALVGIGIQLIANLLVVLDTSAGSGAEESFDVGSIGAVALVVVPLCLPWLAWLFTGSRAIRTIESGIAHAHARAVHASRHPEAISKHVAAYIHGASDPDA